MHSSLVGVQRHPRGLLQYTSPITTLAFQGLRTIMRLGAKVWQALFLETRPGTLDTLLIFRRFGEATSASCPGKPD